LSTTPVNRKKKDERKAPELKLTGEKTDARTDPAKRSDTSPRRTVQKPEDVGRQKTRKKEQRKEICKKTPARGKRELQKEWMLEVTDELKMERRGLTGNEKGHNIPQ